jgi:hypothetical protein
VKAGGTTALCRIDWTILGHAQWGPRCPEGADPNAVAEVVRYFDPASFAHRIQAPVRIGFGLFDPCAPGEGIFTAINALPRQTPCEVFIDPYAGRFSSNLRRFGTGEPGLTAATWRGSVDLIRDSGPVRDCSFLHRARRAVRAACHHGAELMTAREKVLTAPDDREADRVPV